MGLSRHVWQGRTCRNNVEAIHLQLFHRIMLRSHLQLGIINVRYQDVKSVIKLYISSIQNLHLSRNPQASQRLHQEYDRRFEKIHLCTSLLRWIEDLLMNSLMKRNRECRSWSIDELLLIFQLSITKERWMGEIKCKIHDEWQKLGMLIMCIKHW